MADVTVAVRNEANAANTNVLAGQFDVKFQRVRNSPGTGEFKLPTALGAVAKGSVVLFSVADAARHPARIIDTEIVEVSVSDEAMEATRYICEGLPVDLSEAPILPSPGACDLVPSMDQRIWNWASPDYTPDGAWEAPIVIATQGWASSFYKGQPAGWTDGSAQFIWSDDGTADNAPAGVCLFRETITVDAGKKSLDWGCDNYGVLYVNGREVQRGEDFRRKFTYEFTTTAGDLTLAWQITNAEDDGPPGDNPAALLGSLRAGGPEGTVIWRTSITMDLLAYPASIPQIPVGKIIRDAWAEPDILDAWTLIGTDTLDTLAETWATVPSWTSRIYEDSVLDLLDQLAEAHLDWRFDATGKTVRPYVKATIGSTVTFPLVCGYIDDVNANVVDLSWDIERAKFTKLAVRWANGWVAVGSGARWGAVRAEGLSSAAAATSYGTSLLALFGADVATASFEYVPLTWPDDLPFVAFDLHDTWAIPGPHNLATTTNQKVWAITCSTDEYGDLIVDVECGSPVRDRIELLERSQRRGLSSAGGLAAAATSATAFPVEQLGQRSVPNPGGVAHVLVSAPDPEVGDSITAPAWFVGRVVSLRLIGEGSTGTSTATVTHGAVSTVLSGSADGLVAAAAVDVSWGTSTYFTATFDAVGHTKLHILADVSAVNS